MPYNDRNTLNKELSAETILETYFPDVKEWKATYGSFFSRNYSGDLKSVQGNSVSLTRNGIYDVLPEKMFFDVDELRFKEPRDFSSRLSEIYEEERSIKDYFLPFDSLLFNASMRLHKMVSHMADNETELLLKIFFDYDIENETNRYVAQLAPLLLQVSELRADIKRLSNIIAAILQCKVDYVTNGQDNIAFTIYKQGLECNEYLNFTNELKPLFDFVRCHFIPMETECSFKVKDIGQRFVLSFEKPLVLDYNTQL